jgi:RNA:NAD 2'-phosphotransferase (TPT1/KptA family)
LCPTTSQYKLQRLLLRKKKKSANASKFLSIVRSQQEPTRHFRRSSDGKWKVDNLVNHQAAEEHQQSVDEALVSSICISKKYKLNSSEDLRQQYVL